MEQEKEGEATEAPAEDFPNQSTVFDNVNYMGRAVIGSSVSNIEANAIIAELYEYNTDSKVSLAIPCSPEGCVTILGEDKEILHSDNVKSVLYCTQSATWPNCFAFTSGKKGGGMYYCHAFKCKDKDICKRILNCMVTTFNRGLRKKSISDGTLEFEFDLTLEILEESSTGDVAPVVQDNKDTFKLRETRTHHIIVTVRQTTSSTLILERCCGLFLAPSDTHDPDNYMLLDMPIEMEMGTASTGPLYIIRGVWNPLTQPCHWLSGEGVKEATIAIDVVASGVLDPIRFERKTRLKIYPDNERFFLSSRYLSQHGYTVTLKPNTDDKHRRFSLASVTDKPVMSSPSRLKSLFAGIGFVDDYSEDYMESDDEEPLISGTEDGVEEVSEETMNVWENLLEDWTDFCTRPPELVKLARKGIPNSLRPEVWLRLGGVTKADIENNYKYLYEESMLNECPHEQVILWDLNRTFPGNEFFQEGNGGQKRLYHVCKSYAGSDIEVGYCQGLSFIVAVLLLHLKEEEAFALFTVIMKEYQFRDMFKKGFQMLQLKFYVLERLIEDQMPDLWAHFEDHELNTHMYASQWFLTLFSAKFPLGLVYRIVDMFLTEGPDTLFKIAVSLLKLSKSDLLSQDFEGMLKYFRVSLPKRFMNKKQGQKLLSTAASVKLKPGKVAIWEAQFDKIQEESRSLEDPVRRLEHQLKQSIEANHRLEQENDMLVQHLTQNQVNMRHQLDELEKKNLELKRDLSKMSSCYDEVVGNNAALSAEILKTKNLYHSSVIEGDDERARHKLTIHEYHNMCRSIEERHEKEKQELNQEVIEIKAQVGGDVIDIPSEQRLRELEMELAKTKLCLVEANCKAQEYEHNCTSLHEKLRHSETGVLNQLKAKLNR